MVARADRNAGGSGNDGDTGWAFWGHTVNDGHNAGSTVAELDFVNTYADMLGGAAPYGIALRISSEGSTYHNSWGLYMQGNFDATKGWNTGIRLGGWKDVGLKIIKETYGDYDGIDMGTTDIINLRNATGTGVLTLTKADEVGLISLLSGNAAKYAGMTIGRTTATSNFAVAGADAQFFTDSQQGDLCIRSNSNSVKIGVGSGATASGLYTKSGATIIPGSLGVNVDPPLAKVHFEAASTSLANLTNKIYFGKNGDDGCFIGVIYQGSVASDMFFGRGANTDDLIISTANVASPAERFRFEQDGGSKWSAYGAGTATFDASGNITSVSDERLKDIQGSFTRGLKDLEGISPILYKWNKESGNEIEHTYAGFSAQNIQKNIPEAIGQNPEGYLSLQDRPILATLVNAVKELKAENEALKARLDKLEQATVKGE